MTDHVSPSKRSEIMGKIKAKNTKPELAVRRILTNLGYRYRIHLKTIPGRPDIVFTARKKVIFVNGCFWHSHQRCNRGKMPDNENWKKKLERNIVRDNEIMELLAKSDWEVLVLWECELNDSMKTSQLIIDFLGPTVFKPE